MSVTVSYQNGLWDGRPLADWVDEVVAEIVASADPLRVVLFGSVNRGEAGPHSDIDLLVVVDELRSGQRWRKTAEVYRSVRAPVPVDLIVTDPQEIAQRGHLSGSSLAQALTEGRVVYERSE